MTWYLKEKYPKKQMKTGGSTAHLSKWLKSKKLTTSIAGKNAKWLILGLGQDIYRINPEHLIMPQRKEVMNPFLPTHTHTHNTALKKSFS